jgi:flagellar biosynthetic protein FliQ
VADTIFTMLDFDLAAAIHGCLLTTLKLCSPLLLAPLAAGLVIAVLQAITQINDSTVSFLPKLIASGAAAWIAGPFLGRTITDYMHSIMDTLVSIGGQ